jgi:hypothetical protein
MQIATSGSVYDVRSSYSPTHVVYKRIAKSKLPAFQPWQPLPGDRWDLERKTTVVPEPGSPKGAKAPDPDPEPEPITVTRRSFTIILTAYLISMVASYYLRGLGPWEICVGGAILSAVFLIFDYLFAPQLFSSLARLIFLEIALYTFFQVVLTIICGLGWVCIFIYEIKKPFVCGLCETSHKIACYALEATCDEAQRIWYSASSHQLCIYVYSNWVRMVVGLLLVASAWEYYLARY